MLFRKIKINNIRSYENAEVTFPSGSSLLSGDIGTGKTSILLAIEFALFGLQPGQKGASLLRNGEDVGFAELEFEIDGKIILLKRTLKRKKTISQESAFITVDGKTEERSVTEMKSYVLTLLNYPLEFAKKTNLLYRFTVYTPQEGMKQIILEDSESRLNTLRHVFGIDKYKRIKENTIILTSRLRELTRLKQGQVSDLETIKVRLEERKKSFEEIRKQIPEFEGQLADIITVRAQKQRELDEVKVKIDEKRKLENEVEKTNILFSAKREQILNLERDIQTLKMRLEQATKSFNPQELEEVIKKITDRKNSKEENQKVVMDFSVKINSFLAKVNELNSLKEKIMHLKTCPTCLQDVANLHKQNILGETEKELAEISNEKINIDNSKQQKEILINTLNSEIEEFERARVSLEAVKIRMQTIQEDNKKSGELEKMKKTLEEDTTLLEGQIERLRNSVVEFKKFDNILLVKEKEFAEIAVKEKQVEIKKAETVKEIELETQEIENSEKGIREKEQIKAELIYVSELEGWLSKDFLEMIGYIEQNVMLRLKDEFSKLFNEWFTILVPENFVVRLDDSFTPIIEQQGFELDYNFLSGGERTAIALAYRLALNQTINSLLSEIKTKGIVILDEPTDGFSEQQLDKMRDVLGELKVDQLIMVSHDQKIEGFVDNIIRLKKDGNGSGVES